MTDASHRNRPLVLGHRGASAHAADNSIEALELAVAHGADGVEIDVRFTADEVVVLHHDADIGEMGPLIHHRFADLRATHPEIPTLDEALAVLVDLTINVEIKSSPLEPAYDSQHRMADFVAHWVTQHDIRERVIITSFNPEVVVAVRRADAALTTGQLLPVGFDPLAAVEAVAEAGHTWLAPWVGDVVGNAPDITAAAHAAGTRMVVWTVDDPEDIRTLAAAGVDALISNDPQATLRVLANSL